MIERGIPEGTRLVVRTTSISPRVSTAAKSATKAAEKAAGKLKSASRRRAK